MIRKGLNRNAIHFILFVSIFCAASAYAQSLTTGMLKGMVSDSRRDALPGVTVTLTSSDTGASLTTVTNEIGSYRFLGLPPGDYELTFELDGMKKVFKTNINLKIAGSLLVFAQMEEKTETESNTSTVPVTTSGPPVPNPPDGRQGHSMVTLQDGRVMLFGGEGDQGDLKDDLFAYDANGWNNVVPANNPPPKRKEHQAWTMGSKMFVYGGYGENGALNDMWTYDTESNEWHEQSGVGSKPPGPPVPDLLYISRAKTGQVPPAVDFTKFNYQYVLPLDDLIEGRSRFNTNHPGLQKSKRRSDPPRESCFTADTGVLLPGNILKPIGTLRNGEAVMSYHPESNALQARPIADSIRGRSDHYYLINGWLKVTRAHRFLNANGEWVRAENLRPGMAVRSPNGSIAIRSNAFVQTAVEVFNFDVDSGESFIVSSETGERMVVHNGGGGGK